MVAADAPPMLHNTPLRVLGIDDDPGDARLLSRHLDDMTRYQVEYTHVVELAAAQPYLREPDLDVIFLDYQLGAQTGQEVLEAIRASGDIRPVIVLTGQGDESIAASLMRAGADDYLIKGDIDGDRLQRAIENARAQCARRWMEARNRQLLAELQEAKKSLEARNRRLAGLYDTAHQFVDHVSHEFRTPLTVIREFASIMQDGLAGKTTDEQCEYLEVIVNRVDELAVLVDDMLDISKLEAGVLGIHRRDCQAACIVKQVRTTIERRAASSKAALQIDVPSGLPELYCDVEQTGRVIINLVINALKFCGEGGHVTLAAKADASSQEVCFSVSDDGPGIAAETMQLLFTRFRQVEGQTRCAGKGFGLGLSIARELVSLNLGDITVTSEPGAGSTFSFTVPYAERSSLLRRYLRRVNSLRDGSIWVSLIEVAIAEMADAEVSEEIEYLLRHRTRRSDLVFRPAPDRWLVAAGANQRDLRTMTNRLQRAWTEANQNRTGDPLPPMSFAYLGSWNIDSETDAFLEAFAAAEMVLEPVHA